MKIMLLIESQTPKKKKPSYNDIAGELMQTHSRI